MPPNAADNVLISDDLQQIRDVIDAIGAPITLGDVQKDGSIRVFIINRAAEQFYGVPSSKLEGRLVHEINLKPKGRGKRISDWFRACLEANEVMQFRDFAPVDTASGRRWVQTMMAPLRDSQGKPVRVMSTLLDVTDWKRAEDKLSEQLTSALSGFIPICAACKKIRSQDHNGVTLNPMWNPAARPPSVTPCARNA